MSTLPMISAIMPTRNRKKFVTQALKYFHAQEYVNKELIVIDDSDDPGLIPDYPDVRHIYITELLTIGMKRNIACSLAQGEIIAHWDDDDIYRPHRLSQQVEPILMHESAITAFRMSLLLHTSTGTLVECPQQAHRRLFPYGVRAGTLMYPTHLWDAAHHGYGNVNVGEDAAFLCELLDLYELQAITDPSSYICVRHGGNVTRDLDISGWRQVPLEQYLSADERAFYRQFQGVQV